VTVHRIVPIVIVVFLPQDDEMRILDRRRDTSAEA